MKITLSQLRTAIQEVLKEISDEAASTMPLLMDDSENPETERDPQTQHSDGYMQYDEDPIDTIWTGWPPEFDEEHNNASTTRGPGPLTQRSPRLDWAPPTRRSSR